MRFAPRILAATPADAPGLLALQRLAYQSEARLYGDWSIPPLIQSLEELRAEFATHAVLKAVEGDPSGGEALVGSVRARMDAAGICRIGRLMVRPDRQRRGLGAALLTAMEARFPRAGRFALFTGHLSAGNLRLYERLGYRPVERRAAHPGLTLVFLEKPGAGG